tara:strand:+ start:4806 stop:5516 length:711 start_codon:yes stop_codon:yes gene_type:complete
MDSTQMFEPIDGENYYIFAGSTKPYHKGHHEMIMAAINDAAKDPIGKVLLFIGTKDRGDLRGEVMQELWSSLIAEHYYNICENIHIEYGGWGPVGKVLHMLKTLNARVKDSNECKSKVFIYADPKDCVEYYLTPTFSKRTGVELASSPPKYYEHLTLNYPDSVNFMGIIDVSRFSRGIGTSDISGTFVRTALQNLELTDLRKSFPDWMDSYQKSFYEMRLIKSYHETLDYTNLNVN